MHMRQYGFGQELQITAKLLIVGAALERVTMDGMMQLVRTVMMVAVMESSV